MAIVVILALWESAGAWALNDPTRPPWNNPAPVRGARAAEGLRAILLDGPRRLALIDGRLWAIGSRVAGDRLVAIHRNSVVLRGHGRERQVFLAPSGADIRKTAALSKGLS